MAESLGIQASYLEGREFDSQSSQTDDLYNLYLSLPSLALGINRIGQGMVRSELAQHQDNVTERRNQVIVPVGQHYEVTISVHWRRFVPFLI